MTNPVFVIDAPAGPITAGNTLTVTGAEAHHAVTVRRLRAGEPVELVDGQGFRAQGVVETAQRDQLVVQVRTATREPALRPHLSVVQALPKGDRGELAVQMLTEVGVDVIIPWAASRSITRWEGARGQRAWQRWQATAREAAKQSRRAWFPQVAPLATTAQVCHVLAQSRWPMVLHEQAKTSLYHHLDAQPELGEGTPSAVLVIGPEGGISEVELASFCQQACATACRLGPTVLRTSTAGPVAAALTLALTRWG